MVVMVAAAVVAVVAAVVVVMVVVAMVVVGGGGVAARVVAEVVSGSSVQMCDFRISNTLLFCLLLHFVHSRQTSSIGYDSRLD